MLSWSFFFWSFFIGRSSVHMLTAWVSKKCQASCVQGMTRSHLKTQANTKAAKPRPRPRAERKKKKKRKAIHLNHVPTW